MRLFDWSATAMTLLEGITATPRGFQKRALGPTPSANAPPQQPASKLTPPPGVTSLMSWLDWSATTTTPLEAMTATPVGKKNFAAVPVPSAYPAVLPASVETEPEAGSTIRMRWFRESATNIAPLEGTTATA
jgi:hypothetical protein